MFSERFDAWLRRHEAVVDGAWALVLLALGTLLTRGQNVVLDSALLAPLVVRRRYPAVAVVLVEAVAFVQWLVQGEHLTLLTGDLAILITVYSVAAFGPRAAYLIGLAGGFVGAVLGAVRWPAVPTDLRGHLLVGVVLGVAVLGAWSFGRLRGVRHEQLAAITERARLLESERDQRARLAVSAERARIAREMHDVVAHSLAVIIAQADGGRYAAAGSPSAAVGALETISETGRRALGEMRRLLAVLREDAGSAGDAGSPEDAGSAGSVGPGDRLGPQPGIDDVPALVEQVRAGGLDVTLTLAEEARCPDPAVGLVAYRIVQEGLTNVLKHAGPAARARVGLRRQGTDLEVEVLDDGRGAGVPPGSPGAGLGLIGMRERVTAFGGSLETGPRPGGGYAVRARIPAVEP